MCHLHLAQECIDGFVVLHQQAFSQPPDIALSLQQQEERRNDDAGQIEDRQQGLQQIMPVKERQGVR